MEKTRLEVRLEDKTLSIDGKGSIQLDESLDDAHGFEKDKTNYLELRYKTSNPEIVEEDAHKLFSALEKQGLRDSIDATPCPENLERDYLAVGLYGNFDAHIIR